MKTYINRMAGFTLVEVMVSSCLLGVAVSMSLGSFIYVLNEINKKEVQNELDIDVQVAMEKVKYHTRLSALERMVFYPSGAGPYEAISFPMARDDDGDGAVDVDENGDIIWDRTLVYHVWEGNPQQLRLTTFDPRDNALSDSERQQQLDSVATQGDGSGAPNGVASTTEVVFENLFNWSLIPHGGSYEAYSETLERDVNTTLGSCVLGPGPHTFTFEVTGKNPDSDGYKVGIDSLVVSPSYSRREAEEQLPVTSEVGATATRELMSGGSWDGNQQLAFNADAAGQSFTLTMNNDLWEETCFQTGGDSHDNTAVAFDDTLSPADFVVKLTGMNTNWTASAQTGDTNGISATEGFLSACATRVLIKGEEMPGGNWIDNNGGRCLIKFKSGSTGSLQLRYAFIGECSSTTSNSMDVSSGSQKQILFQGNDGVTISAGGEKWSDVIDFPIDRNKSYLVSYLVADPVSSGTPWRWNDTIDPGGSSCFIITSNSTPGLTDVQDETWTDRGDVLTTNCILGVQDMFVTYAQTGTYISTIFDTHCDAPDYTEVNWDASAPGSTDIQLKLRTGGNADLSDAPEWSAVPFIPESGYVDTGNGRYVQFLSLLTADSTSLQTPILKRATVHWNGPERVVDVGGTFTKGPEYGIFELKVDGLSLVAGVTVNLEIFRDTRSHGGVQRVTSSLTTEIAPRNSGL